MEVISDRYELLEVIASGGMATVWKARDNRLNRLVALKRPHPAPPGDESADRLGREARAAAGLNHPNLITIYDFGTDRSGPYLVMELVDGPTLQDAVGQLDPTDVTDLGARLADALATIHAAGIVHRDVKPANVVMSKRGPLLTDFGIATDPNATAEITRPGTVVATPSYAAPEVLRGEPPTPASDVYSLAVVIDELIRKTGATLAPSLDQAIAAALAEAPAERPEAAELAEMLGQTDPVTPPGIGAERTTMILETTPSPSVAPTAPAGDDSTESRPAWMWIAGALVILALGLTGLGLAMSGEDPPADAAMAPTTVVADSSTTTSPSTTTASSTTTSDASSLETRITAARDELESVLTRPPRSDLNPPEVEDVMKKVDEGIEEALEGDLDKAAEKLVETERRLEEKLEDDRLVDARAALHQLADLLGVDLTDRDHEDDG